VPLSDVGQIIRSPRRRARAAAVGKSGRTLRLPIVATRVRIARGLRASTGPLSGLDNSIKLRAELSCYLLPMICSCVSCSGVVPIRRASPNRPHAVTQAKSALPPKADIRSAPWASVLCQASAQHFQQCAEFPLLRNRGLGPLAVTVLSIPLARRAPLPLADRYRCRCGRRGRRRLGFRQLRFVC